MGEFKLRFASSRLSFFLFDVGCFFLFVCLCLFRFMHNFLDFRSRLIANLLEEKNTWEGPARRAHTANGENVNME